MSAVSRALVWLERTLLVTALFLAAWSALLWTEQQYFKWLPVPMEVRALPGDRGDTRSQPVRSGNPAIAIGSWVARLEAPAVGLSATVLEGSDDRTLARAAGHIAHTALPGERGNIGIAGHRDTTFRPLGRLKIGDALVLKTAGRTFEYRVAQTMIVRPEDVYVLDPTTRPTLTLVTCYPFTFIGHAPNRFIVRAEKVR
jgi:sortase A